MSSASDVLRSSAQKIYVESTRCQPAALVGVMNPSTLCDSLPAAALRLGVGIREEARSG